ncbi:MAG: trypsin-like serine protease [Pseudomonadota bacterium]|nr:trypsin-like serine protease [Pseudomonadota bacterium]
MKQAGISNAIDMSACFILRLLRCVWLVACLGLVSAQINAAEDSATENSSAQYRFDRAAIVVVKVLGRQDFCSGVVVGANEVLTATHCVYDLKTQTVYPASTIKIGMGDKIAAGDIAEDSVHWFSAATISMPAASIKTVDDFLGNDITRITTANTLPVTPLSMASFTPGSSSGAHLIAWGFGEDEWGYYGIKKSRPLVTPTVQGNLISFSSGACRGDSGGPVLNDKYQVVGIISLSKVRHCVSAGIRIAQRVDGFK